MLEMRSLVPEEFAEWCRVESRAHSNRLNADPVELLPNFDLDRSIAVFDYSVSGGRSPGAGTDHRTLTTGHRIVGGSHSHLLEMSIPGGTSAVAGVANVYVLPTHTRRGILTRMMRHQLNDIHERGEPLAALFATESVIYGRFGYGVGAVHERWTIERPYNAYARRHENSRSEASGRITFLEPEDITKYLPEVSRRSTEGRPGVFQKPMYRWERESRDPEHRQGGRGGSFYVVYEEDGRMEGYAAYRTGGGTLTVNELMATTREAATALWRYCFDVDLMASTEALKRPVDDPLPWMLADPRRLQRSARDGMWLRVIDARAALEQRRYMQTSGHETGRLVIEVRDEVCPWNETRFELEGSPEGAACRPTGLSPDLTIAVSALASAYLGAVSFSTLYGAGLVDEHTPGGLQRADRMFETNQKPWTPHNF